MKNLATSKRLSDVFFRSHTWKMHLEDFKLKISTVRFNRSDMSGKCWGNWFPINFAAAACLSALEEFMHSYDSEPLSSPKSEKYFFGPRIKISFLGCIPIFTGNVVTVQHDTLALLWFKFNPYPTHLHGDSGGISPPPCPVCHCNNLQMTCSWAVFRSEHHCAVSVYCAFRSSEIHALLYGSSSLSPKLRRELSNGPNIHTDIDLACLMIDFLTQWLTDGSGLLNLQKHTSLPVHQTLKCPHNLKSLHARWLQSNEWTWLGYGSLLLFPCAGS